MKLREKIYWKLSWKGIIRHDFKLVDPEGDVVVGEYKYLMEIPDHFEDGRPTLTDHIDVYDYVLGVCIWKNVLEKLVLDVR